MKMTKMTKVNVTFGENINVTHLLRVYVPNISKLNLLYILLFQSRFMRRLTATTRLRSEYATLDSESKIADLDATC